MEISYIGGTNKKTMIPIGILQSRGKFEREPRRDYVRRRAIQKKKDERKRNKKSNNQKKDRRI